MKKNTIKFGNGSLINFKSFKEDEKNVARGKLRGFIDLPPSLLFFGNGSAFNVNKVNTSAFFVEGKVLNIIDVGYSVFESILNSKILEGEFDSIRIYITHVHDDHVGSLSTLLHYLFYVKGITATVVGGKELKELLELSAKGLYSFFPIHLSVDSTLKATKVYHVENMESYGYLHPKFIYTGDISSVESLDDMIEIHTRIYNKSWRPELYVDCSANNSGVHVFYKDLEIWLKNNEQWRNSLYIMHIDNEEVLAEFAKENDIKIAETI